MISWIQRTFQHHFRLIFAVLLLGMVIPFIFTIGSTPGIGRAEHETQTKEFFGHNLASREDDLRFREDARISASLQNGGALSEEQVQYYAIRRITSLYFADAMHIPEATPAEITNFIKDLRAFHGPDGQFDVTRYDAFRSSLKARGDSTEADIVRVIGQDIRAGKVERLVGGPGYVMPSDLRSVLEKEDTTWTLETATVDYASFEPSLSLSDAEIAKFFSDNTFRYTIAPKVGVDYVAFPAAGYLPSVTATDAEVREYYDAQPSRFPKPGAAKAPSLKADPSADFAAVQKDVRQALLADKAERAAVQAASDFAFSLYQGKVTRGTLDGFLAAHHLTKASLVPFTAEEGPAELLGSPQVAKAAFELGADHFYSEGVPTPTGAAVLLWRESLPSRTPLLAEVRDKVKADAVDSQRRQHFIEFGKTFQAGIERRLKAGEAFDKAVAEAAGSLKVSVKSFPAFVFKSKPADVDETVVDALTHLAKGGVSDLKATADRGVLVYAADKKLPALDESNPDYARFKAQLAMNFARLDSTAILTELMQNELKRSEAVPH